MRRFADPPGGGLAAPPANPRASTARWGRIWAWTSRARYSAQDRREGRLEGVAPLLPVGIEGRRPSPFPDAREEPEELEGSGAVKGRSSVPRLGEGAGELARQGGEDEPVEERPPALRGRRGPDLRVLREEAGRRLVLA